MDYICGRDKYISITHINTSAKHINMAYECSDLTLEFLFIYFYDLNSASSDNYMGSDICSVRFPQKTSLSLSFLPLHRCQKL